MQFLRETTESCLSGDDIIKELTLQAILSLIIMEKLSNWANNFGIP